MPMKIWRFKIRVLTWKFWIITTLGFIISAIAAYGPYPMRSAAAYVITPLGVPKAFFLAPAEELCELFREGCTPAGRKLIADALERKELVAFVGGYDDDNRAEQHKLMNAMSDLEIQQWLFIEGIITRHD